MPLLLVLGLGGLVSALSVRIVEPMVPLLAGSLSVDVHAIAILSSAFTLPYALGQPFLGPLGDARGKERVIVLCLAIVALSLLGAALTPSYELLFACRVVGGLAAGGIIPLQLALIGDTSSMATRQVAISRYLVMVVSGQIIGAPMAGLISDVFGWRAVFLCAMAAVGIVAIVSFRTLHPDQLKNAASRPQIGIREGYAKVLANPKARICYAAVFLEGLFVFGYFPYVSVSLIANHLGGVREGGFVIGGIGIGGVIFSLLAGRLLSRFGRRRLMIVGGGIVLLAFLADGQISSWQAQLAAFAGIGTGFYMLHSALQTEATELAPEVRGSAVALHAFFFFIGQAVGPFFYGWALLQIGIVGVTALAGVVVCIVATVASLLLSRVDAMTAPADQRPR